MIEHIIKAKAPLHRDFCNENLFIRKLNVNLPAFASVKADQGFQ